MLHVWERTAAFFIKNKPVFASGIGNIFEPIEISLKGYYLVLVKPNIFVSTRDAFACINLNIRKFH